MKINKNKETIGKQIQNTITAADIIKYKVTKIKKSFLVLYPSKAATAPSNDPCGTPMNETIQRASNEIKLSSYI